MRKLLLLGTAIAVASGVTSDAFARGWLSKHVIAPVLGNEAANRADDAHEAIGKPLDHAPAIGAAILVESVSPGSGPAAGAAVETFRAFKHKKYLYR